MGKHTRNRSLGAGAGAVGVSIVAAAALYALIRKRERNPINLAAWKQASQEDGSIAGFDALLEHASEKGVDLDAKRAMWPYLLGVFNSSSTTDDKDSILRGARATYEKLIADCQARETEILSYAHDNGTAAASSPDSTSQDLPSPSSPDTAESPSQQQQQRQQSGPPSTSQPSGDKSTRNPFNSLSRVDLPEELRQFYEAQRIIVMDAIRTDFKKNSLTAVDAIASWLSAALCDSQIYQKVSAKEEWWSGYWVSVLAKYQLDHSSHFSTEQKRQVLRLVNLLSAYAVHDPETGYCQGMSDLAIPFLLLFDDDALAFTCFERLMRKVRRNFAVEDSGIFAELSCLARLLEKLDPTLFYKIRQMGATDCHFAYRMIVVLLRRELALDQVLRLWEMLWADDMLRALSPDQPFPTPHDLEDATSPASVHAAESMAAPSFEASLAADTPGLSNLTPLCSKLSHLNGAEELAPIGFGYPDAACMTPNSTSVLAAAEKKGHSNNNAEHPALCSTPSSTPTDVVTAKMGREPWGKELLGEGYRQKQLSPETTAPTPLHAGSPVTADHGGPKLDKIALSEGAAPLPLAGTVSSAEAATAAQLTPASELAGVDPSGAAFLRDSSALEPSSQSAVLAGNPLDIFSYFIAAAVISQRRRILDDCHDSVDMLKHFQTLRVDVDDCMLRAKQYRVKLAE